MSEKATRRALMRPIQLLTIAFVCAIFAGVITALSMGVFQSNVVSDGGQLQHAWMMTGIIAGITFIAVALVLSMLLLALDPSQFEGEIDRPVLLPDDAPTADAGDAGANKKPADPHA